MTTPTETPDMSPESDESLAIQGDEQPFERGMLQWGCLVGNTVNIETVRIGLSREERLSTAEVKQVIAETEQAIQSLLTADKPVSQGGIARIAHEHVRRAEQMKRRANGSKE